MAVGWSGGEVVGVVSNDVEAACWAGSGEWEREDDMADIAFAALQMQQEPSRSTIVDGMTTTDGGVLPSFPPSAPRLHCIMSSS